MQMGDELAFSIVFPAGNTPERSVLYAVILRATSEHAVVLTYKGPWARVLPELSRGPAASRAVEARFDYVWRIPIRAREP
eukprot:2733597-Lingulodinium_polyedra.AAC.1